MGGVVRWLNCLRGECFRLQWQHRPSRCSPSSSLLRRGFPGRRAGDEGVPPPKTRSWALKASVGARGATYAGSSRIANATRIAPSPPPLSSSRSCWRRGGEERFLGERVRLEERENGGEFRGLNSRPHARGSGRVIAGVLSNFRPFHQPNQGCPKRGGKRNPEITMSHNANPALAQSRAARQAVTAGSDVGNWPGEPLERRNDLDPARSRRRTS